MTQEKAFRSEICNAVKDLATITHALSGLELAYDTLNNCSDEAVLSIIRIISNDLSSLHDHFNRLLDDRCTIRELKWELLRADEETEQIHNKIMQEYAA